MSRRSKHTGAEKLQILEEARQPGVTVAEVCRRHQVASSVYYRWEAQMRAGAKEGLSEKPGKGESAALAEVSRLRAELSRKNTVIAELTEALLQEKKGLSAYLRPAVSRGR
jgi:transposase-like protein